MSLSSRAQLRQALPPLWGVLSESVRRTSDRTSMSGRLSREQRHNVTECECVDVRANCEETQGRQASGVY
jgi:hypothetical protein